MLRNQAAPLTAITMSLSALSPPTWRFFSKMPSALMRFSLLPLLTIKEQALSAQLSKDFSRQVVLANRDIPLIQQGSALLEAQWQRIGLNAEQLRLLRQPYGLLILGEGLISLEQVLAIDHPKLVLLTTSLGAQALRANTLAFNQIQCWDEVILLVKIGDSVAYHHRLGTFNALAAFLMKYPEHAEALLQRLKVNDLLLSDALVDVYWLEALAKKNLVVAEQLLTTVYLCDAAFTRLLASVYILKELVQTFPTWHDKLLQRLLTKDHEFERLIGVAADLIQLAEDMPSYAVPLIDFVLANPQQCHRLLINHYAFVQVARFFKTATDLLVDRALTFDLFEVFFAYNDDLINVIEQIPSQAEKVVRYVLAHPADFQRLILYHHELISTAKSCPAMANALIDYVVADSDTFDRLITSKHKVAECLMQFPNHESVIFDAWFRQDDTHKLSCSP